MTKKIYLETLKSVLGRSISHYSFGYSDFRFKDRGEMFLCYSDSSDKKLLEKLLFGHFFVSGYLLLITQIAHL